MEVEELSVSVPVWYWYVVSLLESVPGMPPLPEVLVSSVVYLWESIPSSLPLLA